MCRDEGGAVVRRSTSVGDSLVVDAPVGLAVETRAQQGRGPRPELVERLARRS